VTATADTAFGATSGNITIRDGATLNITTAFTLNAGRTILLGPAVGSGTGTISVTSGNPLTFAGAISNAGGTGSLIKIGSGGLRYNGTANYTGTTSINQGTLTLDNAGSLPNTPPP